MTPLERLLAEELPTGQFGDGPARDSSLAAVQPRPEPAEGDPLAAAHRARLLAALAEKPLRIGRRAAPVRHLHPVPNPTAGEETAA
jgi:hypothetical protein